MVKSIGADFVVDYSKEDFTRMDQKYDLILDNVSSRTFSDLKRCLKPGGMILPNSGYGGMSYVIKAMFLRPFVKEMGKMFLATPNREHLEFLKDLIESGKIKPVMDKSYSFAELAQAFEYMIKEHAKGKIVINMAE
jgi:NADPH:quinone reductase-like Zn-dependent oxidoreductase